MDNDLKCMQALTKLTDEERENVLAWAAKKWPAKQQMMTSGGVASFSDGITVESSGDRLMGKEQRR